jgi:hypothetical protein
MLDDEQYKNWFGSKPAAPQISGFMPGEQGGVPRFDDQRIPEDTQVEAQMIFDSWKKYYQDNPKAIPSLGASPDEKAAHQAAHPFGFSLADTVSDGQSSLDRLYKEIKRAGRQQDEATAANYRPWIIAAVIVAGVAYFLASKSKAIA